MVILTASKGCWKLVSGSVNLFHNVVTSTSIVGQYLSWTPFRTKTVVIVHARWSLEFQLNHQAELVLTKSHLALANPKPYLILSNAFDCNPPNKDIMNQKRWKNRIYIKTQKVPEIWLRKVIKLSTSTKYCLDVTYYLELVVLVNKSLVCKMTLF